MNILIINKDVELCNILSFVLENKFCASVITTASAGDAITTLLDGEKEINLIICDDSDDNFSFFKYILSSGLQTPCIILSQDKNDNVSSKININILGVVGYTNMLIELEKILASAIKSGSLLNQNDDSSEYCRIRAELLIRFVPLKSDVFIRLSKAKFVKLFQTGDSFHPYELEKYLKKKKIEYLYLKKADTAELLEKFNKDIDILLKSDIDDDKIHEISTILHESVQQLGHQLGFTKEVLEIGAKSIQVSIKSMKQNPTLNAVLNRLKINKEKYISSHSMALAPIACSLATGLSWISETTLSKLTFAAFFHDFTLLNNGLAAVASLKELEEKSIRFSNKEIQDYKIHPIAAQDVLSRFNEIPPDVDTIIAQHHEKPDGSGFPRGITATQFAPLSIVFVVAHDVIDYIFEHDGKFDAVDFVNSKRSSYSKSRKFKNVRDAIHKLDDTVEVDDDTQVDETVSGTKDKPLPADSSNQTATGTETIEAVVLPAKQNGTDKKTLQNKAENKGKIEKKEPSDKKENSKNAVPIKKQNDSSK